MSQGADLLSLLADAVAERVIKRLDEHRQAPPMPQRLTAPQVAREFRVRSAVVYEALRSGELQATQRRGRGGTNWVIDRSDAERWMRSRCHSRTPIK